MLFYRRKIRLKIPLNLRMLNETQEPLTSEFARKRLFVKKLSQIGDLVLHVYNLNLCSDEHFLSHFLWQDYVWTINITKSPNSSAIKTKWNICHIGAVV